MSEKSGIMVRGYDRVFLEEARACAERSEREAREDDSTLHAGAAASAVVAACAAVQAFVSERTTYHSHKGNISEDEADEARDATGLHRQLNSLVKSFEEAGIDCHPEYSHLCALWRLRGCIVHRSARFLHTEDWPEDLDGLEGVIPSVEGPGLDWTSRVLNDETAIWAVETAETFLREADKHIGEPPSEMIIAVPPVKVGAEVPTPEVDTE